MIIIKKLFNIFLLILLLSIPITFISVSVITPFSWILYFVVYKICVLFAFTMFILINLAIKKL